MQEDLHKIEIEFHTKVMGVERELSLLQNQLKHLCLARDRELAAVLRKASRLSNHHTISEKPTTIVWHGDLEELEKFQDFLIDQDNVIIDQLPEDFDDLFAPHFHPGVVTFLKIKCKNVYQLLRCLYHLEQKGKISFPDVPVLYMAMPYHFERIFSNGKVSKLKLGSLKNQYSLVKTEISTELKRPDYIDDLFHKLKLE